MGSKEFQRVYNAMKKAGKETMQAIENAGYQEKVQASKVIEKVMEEINIKAEIINLLNGVKIRSLMVDHIPCEWITDDNSDTDTRLLYIHGGGFTAGSLDTHRHLCAQIATAGKCAVLSFEYRLAPENPFPAALDDCMHIYSWMRENGPGGESKARHTFIAGDSAGGNLTIATLLKLKQLGKDQPTAAIALSAALDQTCSLDSWRTRAQIDPMLGPRSEMMVADAGKNSVYLDGRDPKDPMVSPLFGDLGELPPILLQVGDAECMRNDSVEFCRKAKASGVDVQLEVWPEMIHAWQIFAPFLPEGVKAIERIGGFIRGHSAD